ncbi:MAG: DUF4190 domain-containing protein [Bacillus sp. (in: Bacteria)]|nr:DUF4190 domain-containing protein [Bacillus sp. (in: firmicutes)]
MQDLGEELAYIPQKERDQHLLEIEGHLHAIIQEKQKQGHSRDQAVELALKEFLPTDKLAEQIISEVDVMATVNRDSKPNVSDRRNVNVKAIVSLVLGILSILFMIVSLLGIALAIIGIVFGAIALSEIKQFNQDGKKMATAGIICSSCGVLLPIVFAFLAYFVYMNPTIS